MASHLIETLNPAQREAVTAPLRPVLVLAGAGSGKTRVLVHRIAWLIEAEGFSPYSIMAVTFTNKAAAEMRGRIEQLLTMPNQGLWFGTFHSLAHRILRAHWQEVGLSQHFQVIDADDQLRAIRRLLKELNLDEKYWPARQVCHFINNKKEEGLRSNAIVPNDQYSHTLVEIYAAYEALCQRNDWVDFAELLLRSYELWQHQPDILQHYQQRFRYVLVDEFQDTNTLQYAWLKQLVRESHGITVVGDDDQSIYSWRGANIHNIQQFTKDFPDAQLIRLEQNYRSTGTILRAANAIIANNRTRLGKQLWTEGKRGEPIDVYAGFNEIDEARFIVNHIQTWLAHGNRRDEVAILYRSNAQSRVLEENLLQAGIPYRVYGGLRFYERAEIKDALAYLRLLSNRSDDTAFERIVNTPTRGIGHQTLDKLRDFARHHQLPLWHASIELIKSRAFTTRTHNALVTFLKIIDQLEDATKEMLLHEQTEYVLHHSGLIGHYQKGVGEREQAKLENLEELITATREFERAHQNESLPPLIAFLTQTALDAGEEFTTGAHDYVHLMTLHAAKGLEFPLVFMCGMEEGLFPHQLSIAEPGRLEEERRLCYVGMTRAMQKLVFTYAEKRRWQGKEVYHRLSRFVAEIPEELLQEVRLRNRITRPLSYCATASRVTDDSPYAIGKTVCHPKFGEGVILNLEGTGEHTRLHIRFAQHGTKCLVAAYANLTY